MDRALAFQVRRVQFPVNAIDISSSSPLSLEGLVTLGADILFPSLQKPLRGMEYQLNKL